MSIGEKAWRMAIVGFMAVVLGITGCKSNSDRSTGQKINDRMTARDVRKALANAPVFKYPDVDAKVYDGTVQLTGFVSTPEQRNDAAQITSEVKGVRQVVNNIMIKPTPTGRATVRDPLGRETGRVMVDTNAAPPKPLDLGPYQQTQTNSNNSPGQ